MTSVSPFVRRLSFQSPVLTLKWTGLRVPVAIGVVVAMDGGVASTIPPNATAESAAAPMAKRNRLRMGSPIDASCLGGASARFSEPTWTSSPRQPCLQAGARDAGTPPGAGRGVYLGQ